MKIPNLATAIFFATITTFSGIAEAQAAQAVVVSRVNVRAGPSTRERVVGRLFRGDRVTVTRCDRSHRWCHVRSRHSRSGWVFSRYLDRIGPRPRHRRPATSICFWGSRGYVCINK